MRGMADVTVLERELFTVAQAAQLYGVNARTLEWWLEGGERRHKAYGPVIRSEPTGNKMVTWGEFVEVGFLREYRRVHGVKLNHLRRFIRVLRERWNVPYPLAHFKPFIGTNAQLIIEAQNEAELPVELWMIAPATGQQTLLMAPAENYLSKVEFSEESENCWATRLHPHGKGSPVRYDPDFSYGWPTVQGIRTEIISELVEAGEPLDEVATTYGLTTAEVKAAVAYEFQPTAIAS